jgi:hypothetical protein
MLVNLRRDPYERYMEQSEMYVKWWADRMFVMVPAQVYVQQFAESLKEFPPATGSSLSIDQVLAPCNHCWREMASGGIGVEL